MENLKYKLELFDFSPEILEQMTFWLDFPSKLPSLLSLLILAYSCINNGKSDERYNIFGEKLCISSLYFNVYLYFHKKNVDWIFLNPQILNLRINRWGLVLYTCNVIFCRRFYEDAVCAETKKWVDSSIASFLQDGIRKFPERWDKFG